jgi:hypothetical protein
MLRSRTSRQSVALTILNFRLGVEENRLPKDLILSRYAVETPNLSWQKRVFAPRELFHISLAWLLLLPLLYTKVVFNHMALAFVGTVFAGVLPGSELTAGPAAHLPELVALRTKGG